MVKLEQEHKVKHQTKEYEKMQMDAKGDLDTSLETKRVAGQQATLNGEQEADKLERSLQQLDKRNSEEL